MDDEIRKIIWIRDKGTCQECGIKLTKTVYPPNPKDEAAKELNGIKEIPIIKWNWKCWNCDKETPIVTYHFKTDGIQTIGSVDKLDKFLLSKYSFVNKIYTNSGRKFISNVCINCKNLQGNTYVETELRHSMAGWNEELKKQMFVDFKLSNNLTVEDLKIPDIEPPPYEERILNGEIHHVDFNWQNDEPSNLILLCKSCHSKLGKKSTASQSRKIVKANAKSRKQKKEADKWRENYYAQKAKRNKTL